jgi:anti-sigma B factor antagonist
MDDVPVEITVEHISGCAVMTLAGELDILAVSSVRGALVKLITHGASRVIVDLTDVDFMDSAGLGALVMAHKRARVVRGRFAIVCSSDGAVRRVLTLTGLIHVLRVFDTRADAVVGTSQARGDVRDEPSS